MDAKDFLQMGIDTRIRIRTNELYAKTLRAEIENMKALCGDMPKLSTKERPIQEALQKACEILNELDAENEIHYARLAEVQKVIQVIDDPLCQEVLTRRFVQGEDWPQIADEMFYSVRGIFKVASRAMEQIEVPEKYKAM